MPSGALVHRWPDYQVLEGDLQPARGQLDGPRLPRLPSVLHHGRRGVDAHALAYTYPYTHTCTHVYTHACIHAHTHTYVYAHTSACVCVCVQVGLGSTSASECVCLETYYNTLERDANQSADSKPLCAPCMSGALCTDIGVRLETLPLRIGYYRMALTTTNVRRCPDASAGCTADDDFCDLGTSG